MDRSQKKIEEWSKCLVIGKQQFVISDVAIRRLALLTQLLHPQSKNLPQIPHSTKSVHPFSIIMSADQRKHENALKCFKEFTGHQNEADVLRLLAICQWDVEHAINVFFMRKSRAAAAADQQQEQWDDNNVTGGSSDQPAFGVGSTETNYAAEKTMPSIGGRRQWTTPPQQIMRHNGISRWTAADTTSAASYRWDQAETSSSSSAERNRSELKFDHDQMVKENEINEMLEKVRHPMPSTQGILLEQDFYDTYNPMVHRPHDPVFAQFPASSTSQIARFEHLQAAKIAFNFGTQIKLLRTNTRMDLGSEIVFDGIVRSSPSECGTSNGSDNVPKRKNLKNLYSPPIELMFRGDWDQTLELAKKKKTWLMVNVQNALEFASAKLNRDIWSSETVQEIIKANFVFWQVYHDSSDGCRIRAYYGLDDSSCPIIFIVDPRTGEEVHRLPTPPADETVFLDLLTTFLAENPCFESRDRHFVGVPKLSNDCHTQQQINNAHNDEPISAAAASVRWTSAQLSTDEWTKWVANETELVKPCPAETVQLAFRLPSGRTERHRLWKAAPLSAVFSLLLSKGHSWSNNYQQLVLDFPRREFVLSKTNRFSTLDEVGFGPQELIHVSTNTEE